MRRLLLLVIVTTVSLLGVTPAKAAHLRGGDVLRSLASRSSSSSSSSSNTSSSSECDPGCIVFWCLYISLLSVLILAVAWRQYQMGQCSLARGSSKVEPNLPTVCAAPGCEPSMRRDLHHHALVRSEKPGGWTCDRRGDGCLGGDGGERYRCAEGCDVDLCAACYRNGAEKVGPEIQIEQL